MREKYIYIYTWAKKYIRMFLYFLSSVHLSMYMYKYLPPFPIVHVMLEHIRQVYLSFCVYLNNNKLIRINCAFLWTVNDNLHYNITYGAALFSMYQNVQSKTC